MQTRVLGTLRVVEDDKNEGPKVINVFKSGLSPKIRVFTFGYVRPAYVAQVLDPTRPYTLSVHEHMPSVRRDLFHNVSLFQ